jgi:hypothetical protein
VVGSEGKRRQRGTAVAVKALTQPIWCDDYGHPMFDQIGRQCVQVPPTSWLDPIWPPERGKETLGLPPERLERWFVRAGDNYCPVPEIRNMLMDSPYHARQSRTPTAPPCPRSRSLDRAIWRVLWLDR